MVKLFHKAERDRIQRIPAPGTLALTYLIFIIMGMCALKLPFATHGNVTWFDALFTSTSAVTVTGLVVVDTGTAFTFYGQLIIALLIQLGGLGLMTFAVLLLSALGIPIGMPQKLILREDLNQTSISNLAELVRVIFTVAVISEMIGTFVLSFVFVPEFGWSEGIWQALFHTISAFNNAGFALFPDSLSRWASDPVINIFVPAMFILGGLGFVVLGDIYQRRKWRLLSLHTKLMLSGTLALIIFSFITFTALEWNNPETLGAMGSASERLWAGWFQSVTPRTAGFNTINTGGMYDGTTLLTIALMLIGGGSTSTAGGIKVTTFIVLVLATIAFFRKHRQLNAFGRSISNDEVMKVMALTTITILIVFFSVFFATTHWDGEFLDIAFEVASAFGTVGLSLGITADLDALDRSIIMFLMFLGRVGPLTLGFFLATNSAPRVRYPAGQIYLG